MSSRIVEYFQARSVVVYPYRWWLGILAVLLVALMFSLLVRPDGSVNLVWVAFIWSAFVWLWGGEPLLPCGSTLGTANCRRQSVRRSAYPSPAGTSAKSALCFLLYGSRPP